LSGGKEQAFTDKERKSMRKINIFLVVILMIVTVVVVWTAEALLDYYLYYGPNSRFLDILYKDLPKGELLIRLAYIILIIMLELVFLLIYRRLRRVGLQLDKGNLYLKSVLNSIGDAVITTDTRGLVTGVNPVAEALIGKSESEILEQPLSRIFNIRNAKTGEMVENPADKVMRAGKTVGLAKYTVLTSYNGEQYHIADSASPIKDGDKITGVVLVFRNVSEQYKIEETHREAEAKYRSLFHETPVGNFHYDANGIITDCNARFVEIIGSSKPALVGLNMLTQLQDKLLIEAVRESLETGKAYYEDYYKSVTANKITPVRIIFKGIRNSDGEITGGMGLVEDITERKKAEGALKRSEEALLKAQSIGKMGSWELDLSTGAVNVSEQSYKIYGYEPGSALTIDDIKEIPLKEYRDSLDEAMKNLISEGKIYNEEFRIKRVNDGQIIDIHSVAEYDKENNKVHGILQDITLRKKAKRDLKKREKLMRYIIQHDPGGRVVFDKEMNHIFVSKSFLEDYKVEEKDVIGKNHYDVFPAIPKRWREIHQRALNGEVLRGDNDYFVHEDGSADYTRWVCRPWYIENNEIGGMILYTDIITELVTIEKKLSQSEKRFRSLAESAPVGIIISDKKGKTIFQNSHFTKITGYTMEDVPSIDHWWPLAYPDEEDRKYVKGRWSTLNDEASGNGAAAKPVEALIRCKDGKEKHVELRLTRADEMDYVLFTDITERKVAEKEILRKNEEYLTANEELNESLQRIREINVELEEAKERAEESDRLKTIFLANMSHEIRTPMNGILGFASLLKQSKVSEKQQKKYLEIIEQSGERMLNTINDLIDISRIEAKEVKLYTSELDLNDAVNYLYGLFKPDTDDKNLSFSYALDLNSKSPRVVVDKEKLYAVFMNLIKNAVKYTNEGHIEFGITKSGEILECYVKDTGIGIPEERREAIFDRFVQADMNIAQPYEGAGLGLAIVRGYLELLGGDIRVESSPGEGAAFYFKVPTETDSFEKDKLNTPDDSQAKAGQIFADSSVLVVDDDEISRLYLAEILEPYCKEINTAKSGKEAIEAIRKKPSPDIVLMDIKMPGMDGYEATRKIREFNEKVIIIAQTAYAMQADRKKSLDAGCNAYISKPILRKELIELISSVLFDKD
jgi:PAS domain S-box-containing protein